MSELSKSEKRLVAKLLEMAGDSFDNHGCNDLFDDFWYDCGLTEEDEAKLLREMRTWNNPDEPWPEKIENVGDAALMKFFAAFTQPDQIRNPDRGTNQQHQKRPARQSAYVHKECLLALKCPAVGRKWAFLRSLAPAPGIIPFHQLQQGRRNRDTAQPRDTKQPPKRIHGFLQCVDVKEIPWTAPAAENHCKAWPHRGCPRRVSQRSPAQASVAMPILTPANRVQLRPTPGSWASCAVGSTANSRHVCAVSAARRLTFAIVGALGRSWA